MTFSAFASYVVYSQGIVLFHLGALAGIFLLAAGASALNQYQERELDAKMDRTQRRPIPLKVIKPGTVLALAILLIISGLAVLMILDCRIAVLLGIFNVLWYNGFYTWLKRKTPFAVVPGALTGAIPVMMGWTAAGGNLLAPEALLLSAFIFLWQVPHFWLLMLQYSDDYRKAGIPVVSDIFLPRQIRSVTFAWLAASSAASLLLLHFRVFITLYASLSVLFLSVTLMMLVINQFFFSKNKNYRLLFISVNVYLLLVLALLIVERI